MAKIIRSDVEAIARKLDAVAMLPRESQHPEATQ